MQKFGHTKQQTSTSKANSSLKNVCKNPFSYKAQKHTLYWIVKIKQGLRVQISRKQRGRTKKKLGFRCTTGTQGADDRQGLVKLSILWPLDSKLSSNVIPVILGHSWFSSSSQIRLRQNLLMILKAVAIPLTPILWSTLLTPTLSLSIEER